MFNLRCPGSDRIEVVEGWIDDLDPKDSHILLTMTTADQRKLTFLVDRSLLEQSAVFKVLNELQGRRLRVLALQGMLRDQPITLESPNQLEIRP
jgi:hypothetical protein